MTRHPTRTRSRRGHAAAIFALVLPGMMGMTAFGVDYGFVTAAQVQSQAVADAAAIAATTTMGNSGQGTRIAQAYADKMSLNGVRVNVEEVTYGTWNADARTFVPGNRDANAVRVRTEAVVPMRFAKIFDLEQMNVQAEAGAGPKVLPNRAPDTVVVLDTTQSMNRWEIRAEREAAEALFECVHERSSPDSRVSVVLFGGVDTEVIGMTEYGTEWSRIDAAADQIRGCSTRNTAFNPCSHTNPASGYEAALQILAEADTPDEVGQAIVLMSDGLPTVNQVVCSPGFRRNARNGHHRFPVEERCDDTGGYIESRDLNNWALNAKADAERRDVDVYTTYYGTDNRGSDWLSGHVTAGGGSHHRALTRHEIADTFVDICVQFTGGGAGLLF